MTFDALIGSLVHHFNRKMMRFPEAQQAATLPPPRPETSYLLYLHVPYCTVLCPFCTFHRVRFEQSSASTYFNSLRQEIDIVSAAGYTFDEIYVGGGTPTVLPEELIATIEHAKARHSIGNISAETNPDHVEEATLLPLRDAGVTRLSVGVQSFDDVLLGEMGRLNKYGSGAEISARLHGARDIFETLNVDMIFNLPHQTEDSLRRDLDILIDDVGAEQVSYYPLMAPDSVKETMRRDMGIVEHRRERDFYELVAERFLSAGYVRDTGWCFSRQARELDEYISRREEYVGLGSGAFSYLAGQIFAATFSIPQYLDMVASGTPGTVRSRPFRERDQMRYYLLVTLFSGQLDKAAAERRFGGQFQRALWLELSALQAMDAIRDTGESLRLTKSGYYLWVVLMREFFTGINSLRDDLRHDSRKPGAALPVR